MSFSAFEHKLLKVFKEDYSKINKIWVSCSFGEDSLSLLNALIKINPVLKLDLKVVHIHHGENNEDLDLNTYRDKALKETELFCKENGLNFKFFKSSKNLISEEECREFRFQSYKELEAPNIFTGHHKQDLVETLMMKMIRGVGLQGFYFGDKVFEGFKIFRPLLGFDKKEILAEINLQALKPLKDPTNFKDDYLRNWIRNSWLKTLEEKRAGSIKSLGESLVNIQSTINQSRVSDFQEASYIEDSSLPLSQWLSYSSSKKKEVIAMILSSKSPQSFTSGQVSEVIKQLDLLQKEHRFKVAGLLWEKSLEKIRFVEL